MARALLALKGGGGKGKAMPTTDGLNRCGAFQQMLHMRGTLLLVQAGKGNLE